MKGIICYYSGSGNTKLACEYIKKKIQNTDFELCNIVKEDIPDFNNYDIVGFATFTDYWAPAQYFYDFFDRLEEQNQKNAFVFNTYGFFSGKLLKVFGNMAKSKGFNVINGYSLNTPENFAPMRLSNKAGDHFPTDKQLAEFNHFIAVLDDQLSVISKGNVPDKVKLKIKFPGHILRPFPRTMAKKDFGIQEVDAEKCKECGVCEKGCPYEAIKLDPKPIFQHEKCFGCWRCYNNCASQAIFTPKFHGEFQYSRPVKALKEKIA